MNNITKINDYASRKKWTNLLSELTPGNKYTLTLASVDCIRSLRAVAYASNSDGKGPKYYISANKETLEVTIRVVE